VPLPICYLNGEYLPLAEARVSPLDRAFLFGDAVYEVVPVYASRPFRLREHLDRLARSLAGIRMDPPFTHAEWDGILKALVERNGGGDQYVYFQVTRGAELGRNHAWPAGLKPTVFAFSNALEPASPALLEQGVAAITAQDIRWARRDIKSTALLANVLLKNLAVDAGAFETILLERGELTEGSSTTVHVIKGGGIHTPPNSHRGALRHSERRPPRHRRGATRRGRNLARLLHPRRVAGDPAGRQAGGYGQGRPFVRAHARRLRKLRARARRDSAAVTQPLEFPTEFPIKVMGRRDSDLKALTRAIIERHSGPLADDKVRVRTSGDGNFLALTYVVTAQSREQLDSIYRELTACKAVLMAL
jgi:D-alanine transaminase